MKYLFLVVLTFVFFSSFSQVNNRFKLEDDHEFDNGSGITFSSLNSDQINNLALLGKVWGFLKYYHPYVASGNINWDYELFRMLPSYLNVKTKLERNRQLMKFASSLVDVSIEPVQDSINRKDIKFEADLNWIKSRTDLGDSLSRRLVTIKNSSRARGHYYLSFLKGSGTPIFTSEKAYSSMRFPDTGFRLLTLFRYWNIINYFFPYKYLIKENWEDVLLEFIPRFTANTNQTDYNFTTMRMISKINDSHANLRNQVIQGTIGTKMPPISAAFVNDKFVITGYFSDTLQIQTKVKPGDIILKINSRRVKNLVEEFSPVIPASNKATKLRDLAYSCLLATKNDELTLELLRGRVKSKVTVPALYSTQFKFRQDFEVNSSAKGYYLIKKDIGYLLPSKFKSKDVPEIKSLLNETKGIVLDMRCYPADYMLIYRLGEYFKSSKSPFVKFTTTSAEQPGLFSFTLVNENGGGKDESYKGKVVILVNEKTQSMAEFTTMAFQGLPNVIVIGSTTAGADGNVTHFKLPGGISTSFSGLGVYYPDGAETQQVGIRIDIPVKPSIAGIKAGKDELLEKAFDLIEK